MSTFAIVIGGKIAQDFAASFTTLEIEENVDQPGAFSLTLPVNRTDAGDYDVVNDSRLAPLSTIAIVATAGDNKKQCLFDGYVLAQTAHLDTGTVASNLTVWGQDATWLMNTTERVREWTDVTDGDVANSIFSDYGFTPDTANRDDDSPTHTSDGCTLMQRSTDAQFLRLLARRNGKELFRVFCTSTPRCPLSSFALPSLDGDPVVTLTLNDSTAATVNSVDISWDVIRPSANTARQTLFSDNDSDGAGGTNERALASLCWKPKVSASVRRDHCHIASLPPPSTTQRNLLCAPNQSSSRLDGSSAALVQRTSTASAPSCAPALSPGSTQPVRATPASTTCGAFATRSPRSSTS